MNPNRPDPRSLPADVREALADLPDREQDRLRAAWEAADVLHGTEPPADDLHAMGDAIWAAVERSLDADRLPRDAAPRPVAADRSAVARAADGRGRLRRFVAGALVATLFVALATAFWMRPVSVTADGAVATLTLPDGSDVTLNAGSRVTYSRTFGSGVRLVNLEGEAFFVVEPSDVPFVVQTFNANVRVVGTAFNVRAWEDEQVAATKVAVREGRVELRAMDAQEPVPLAAGEAALVRQGADAPSAARAIDATELAWIDGRMVFVDKPLEFVLRDVERRFDVIVKLSPRSLMSDSVTYMRDDVPPSAAAVLQDLAEGYGYTLSETPHGFRLRAERASE